MSLSTLILLPAFLLPLALARTDLTGCTSTDVSSPAGASLAWYVPGTGELCDFLDCGGGRAPPKTDVPGCPLYSGTASYSPSFMPGWGSATATPTAIAAASSTTWAAPTATSTDDVISMSASTGLFPSDWETDTATSAWDLYTTSASDASVTWASATGDSASLVTSRASLWSSGVVSPSAATYTVCNGNSTCSLSAVVTSASNATLSTVVGSTGAVRSGTAASASGSSNGASSTGTSSPVSTVSVAGAVETARVWLGSAVMVGLGAVVVAL